MRLNICNYRILCLSVLGATALLQDVRAGTLDVTAWSSGYGSYTPSDSAGQAQLHADLRFQNEGVSYVDFFAEGQFGGKFRYALDLPQAWIRVGDRTTDSAFLIGRVHPLHLMNSAELNHGWGLIAQTQALNSGLALGPRQGLAFSQPVVVGWLGAHWVNTRSNKSGFQFGFSASPVFIPSMGAGVEFGDDGTATTARFGRSPPAFADLGGGVTVPVHYRIDMSRILTDVVFQPQLAAFANVDLSSLAANLRTSLLIQRAPSPDPDLTASGYLQVTSTDLYAMAVVTPKFPERLSALSMTEWSTGVHAWDITFFGNLRARDDRLVDGELGVRNRYLSFSYLDRLMSPVGGGLTEGPALLSKLLQLETALPLASRWVLFAGMKRHLWPQDLWISGGIRTDISGFRASLGMDVFAGGDTSWFGEWRANDRVILGISREIGI